MRNCSYEHKFWEKAFILGVFVTVFCTLSDWEQNSEN